MEKQKGETNNSSPREADIAVLYQQAPPEPYYQAYNQPPQFNPNYPPPNWYPQYPNYPGDVYVQGGAGQYTPYTQSQEYSEYYSSYNTQDMDYGYNTSEGFDGRSSSSKSSHMRSDDKREPGRNSRGSGRGRGQQGQSRGRPLPGRRQGGGYQSQAQDDRNLSSQEDRRFNGRDENYSSERMHEDGGSRTSDANFSNSTEAGNDCRRSKGARPKYRGDGNSAPNRGQNGSDQQKRTRDNNNSVQMQGSGTRDNNNSVQMQGSGTRDNNSIQVQGSGTRDNDNSVQVRGSGTVQSGERRGGRQGRYGSRQFERGGKQNDNSYRQNDGGYNRKFGYDKNVNGKFDSQQQQQYSYGGMVRRKKGELRVMKESKQNEEGEKGDKQEGFNPSQEKAGVKKWQQNKNPQFSNRKNYRGRNKASAEVDESQRGVMIDQLVQGTYECMVCCDTVRAQNAIWGCDNCYHVFHLRCIKKWAKSPNAVVSGAEKDGWRCPACSNLTFKFPNQYRCFCGKVRDPEFQRNETPHSCGEVCSKARGEGCKHPCNVLCHPGPCPMCNAMVTKSCDCGKTKLTVKCGQSASVKCTSKCEKQLNCGKHFCQALCHSGPCDKCEVTVTQECYCTARSREVVCGSKEYFMDSYCCGKTCSRVLDCGNHTCERECHPGPCDGCPTLPARCTHCPCGARPLVELSESPRVSCLDPIPVCDSVCGKLLPCGSEDDRHTCVKTCHNDDCPPCKKSTGLRCRCGAIQKEIPCTEAVKYNDDNPFLCDKRCNKKRTCGRHKCGQKCCVKTEHLCEQLCGGKLSCGLHKCDEPCHRGNCPPCLMASFDELPCYCGTEVMFPPVPCGARPPECHRPCTREHTCNHQVRHSCHSDQVCPPCTELTTKPCMGGHVKRKNIPCHLTEVSCGMPCGRPLPCGQHKCLRICHKGECLVESEVCKQPCPLKREFCDHPCAAPCHADQECPKTPCKATISVKCACGHREGKTVCGKGGIVKAEASDYQRITMQNLADALQGSLGCSSVDINKFSVSKRGLDKRLECNEECALIERNKRVALALEIQNPDLTAKLGNPTYSDFLKDFTKQNQHFVATVEKAFSDLVQSAKQSKQTSRSHSFPNMNNNQRRVIHELAEHYGCETQSYDYEPKKNVVATARRDRCWLPTVTLTALVQRELHPRAPMPIPHVYKEEALRQTAQAAKMSTKVLGDCSRSGSGMEGWNVVGKKKTKSAMSTLDNFDEAKSSGATKPPVVDYFDFSVT